LIFLLGHLWFLSRYFSASRSLLRKELAAFDAAEANLQASAKQEGFDRAERFSEYRRRASTPTPFPCAVERRAIDSLR